jgi:hypothetical protein
MQISVLADAKSFSLQLERKFAIEQAMKAQFSSRGMVLLFL